MQVWQLQEPFYNNYYLSEIYFKFCRFILLVQTKPEKLYKLWQQHKQLKAMEMSEVWPYIMNKTKKVKKTLHCLLLGFPISHSLVFFQ